ncbi:MAG: hypothetical protein CME70_24190 [Halobacteriovorax sp.]|nr:hypothetical protein [Halobacteriovorax sp.]|tara:strand:+ start:18614 stop:19681 length:1068 start_codon:yes stop_codon:yes gene_type:complete
MRVFNDVIQASLEELIDYKLMGEFESLQLENYALAIKAHISGDTVELQKAIDSLEGCFKKLANYRLAILNKEFQTEELSVNEDFMGEAHFLMGLNFVYHSEHLFAKKHFQKAYQFLWRSGAKKKAIKSLLNVVVSESRENNHKKLIVDYEFITKKALSIGDNISAGISQLNISREFQMLGAFELAFKTCNRAINLLEGDLGTSHYYFAIIHRCHLLVDLKRFPEALVDFQKAKASPFKENKKALDVVEALLGDTKEIDLSHLEPTWKARLQDHRNGVSFKDLTESESQLVKFLSSGPKSKLEIIDELYGKNLDFESVDSRFRVLLMRLRKKKPNLVVYYQKKYEISDENFLSEIA